MNKDEAEKICHKNCGDNYCIMACEGAECSIENTHYCMDCNVGFKAKVPNEQETVCPFCGATVYLDED